MSPRMLRRTRRDGRSNLDRAPCASPDMPSAQHRWLVEKGFRLAEADRTAAFKSSYGGGEKMDWLFSSVRRPITAQAHRATTRCNLREKCALNPVWLRESFPAATHGRVNKSRTPLSNRIHRR